MIGGHSPPYDKEFSQRWGLQPGTLLMAHGIRQMDAWDWMREKVSGVRFQVSGMMLDAGCGMLDT
jgi:hypothetical protein